MPSPAPDHMDNGGVHNATHDMRYRVGVNAVTSGPTQTAVPDLIKDWKIALYEAAAEERAEAEVIAPVLQKALARSPQRKGPTRMARDGTGQPHPSPGTTG